MDLCPEEILLVQAYRVITAGPVKRGAIEVKIEDDKVVDVALTTKMDREDIKKIYKVAS